MRLAPGSTIFVALLDNVLKPWLIGTSIQMPLALVIVGVFGGFLSYGFLGLFIGPVLIAIAYALLVAWRADTRAGPATNRRDAEHARHRAGPRPGARTASAAAGPIRPSASAATTRTPLSTVAVYLASC